MSSPPTATLPPLTRPLALLALLLLPAAAPAEDAPGPAAKAARAPETASAPRSAKRPEQIVVIGSRDQAQNLTGAGHYIDAEDFQIRGYADINRALRIAPGVYLREEDGYGLFANISLRGVDSQRTSKLTLMEDGVLTAPAPYSDPAAYYSPTVGRMSSLEVLKGSSQIRFGPHTTGGVINYRSTPIPESQRAHVAAAYGTDHEIRAHGFAGNAWSGDWGRIGVLGEYLFRETDGFKELDLVGGDTGFRQIEPMVKLFWEPPTQRSQRFEAKLGFSQLDADETYLGLTDGDFARDPERRYAASRFDHIPTRHIRSYLRWTSDLSETATLTTTAFYNHFERNWFKLQGDGRALADPAQLAIWKGQAPGELRYRNNRRDYYVGGLESILDWSLQTGALSHDLRMGLRLTQDRVRRDQNDERYTQDAQGRIVAHQVLGDCSGGCRWERSRALALFVQDSIELGKLTLEPGLRLERVGQRLRNYSNTGVPRHRERDQVSAWSPGIGARFDLNDQLRLFGGVHRGVFLPGPSARIGSGVHEETSVGTELGARWTPAEFLGAELTLFRTDFDDLIVVANIGSGGALEDENVGDVIAQGMELSAHFDPGAWLGWGFGNPWQLALTLTDAELDGDAISSDPESLFAGGRDGNDVPYIPRYQLALRTGLEFERVSFHLDALWVDKAFTTASNSSRPFDFLGRPDFNYGTTDDYVLLDLSARYRLSPRLALTANLHNALDEEYIVSRHPIGPRPGHSRQLLVGFEYDWE
jgi:Fe(3+) dicitrate transport protein